ncbi:C13 family peptidase [Methylomicrobium agile]|uniref:C13 family peptidase n=1 Tax=Methylomicrobium agile TaxID=39774 RepID=UPI00068D5708|nr:C13 family peptidase [Methylomicrobium agile]
MNPISNLSTNLHNGLRLAFFRKRGPENFVVGLDPFLLLLLVDLLLETGSGYLLYWPDPEFQLYALPVYTFELACFLMAAWLTSKFVRRENAALQIGVVVYSLSPALILLQTVSRYLNGREFESWPDLGPWFERLAAVYLLILLGRALFLVCGRWRSTTAGMALVLLSAGPAGEWFADYRDFWYSPEEQEVQDGDPYARYKALDAERLMYRQPVLLEETLSRLRPERKGRVDLFYLGFASYATEDVFSIEADYIKRLFDERFGTVGHSLNLVNHLDTLEDTPLATATNLAQALKRIGRIMNPDEDVLFLYLTSHGGSDHKLAVEFWPLPLNDLSPEQLKAMLDQAGIKWRVVVVSACYSGTFVDALKGPHTLVATAAAHDRTSFGCGSESDFTYFGEAVFKQQLQSRFSLIPAFKAAAASIAERERWEKLEASRPQLWVGKPMEAHLADLEKSLTRFQCEAGRRQAQCAE